MQQEITAAQAMKLFPLTINDRVQVTPIRPDEEDPVCLLSRVEDISGAQISLGWPTSGGIRAILREGDKLQVFFIKDAVYLMECTVLSRALSPVPVVVVGCQAPVRKAQRREYVRVSAKVDVHLSAKVVKFGKERHDDPVSYIDARTHSISGAGFAIRHNCAPDLHNLYEVKLSFPDCENPISANAEVVRCESEVNHLSQRTYNIGFAFTRIKESDRRRVVSFVFRTQQNSLVP
jgi:c-di-GMP-binding flagellar brake protein YcgR